MKLPSNQEEILDLVKQWGWTVGLALLSLLVLWKGLTLYQSVQSWRLTNEKVQHLLRGGDLGGKKKELAPFSPESRSVDSTFFFRPPPEYQLTAILGNYAVINGQEVRVGDRIEKAAVDNPGSPQKGDRPVKKAVVEKIAIGSVTIREEGAESPREILIHPGL
jgi:hypothetical protein